MDRLFNNRNYSIALAAIGAYSLFHVSWVDVLGVGIPAIYLALHPLFVRPADHRRLEKHFLETDEVMAQHIHSLGNLIGSTNRTIRYLEAVAKRQEDAVERIESRTREQV